MPATPPRERRALAALRAGVALVRARYVADAGTLPPMVALNCLRELHVLLGQVFREEAGRGYPPAVRRWARGSPQAIALRTVKAHRTRMERSMTHASAGASPALVGVDHVPALLAAAAAYHGAAACFAPERDIALPPRRVPPRSDDPCVDRTTAKRNLVCQPLAFGQGAPI